MGLPAGFNPEEVKMQGTLTVECACGVKVGQVAMDTAGFGIGALERSGDRVRELLDAHRQGHCSVYNPAAPEVPKVHLRTPRFRRR